MSKMFLNPILFAHTHVNNVNPALVKLMRLVGINVPEDPNLDQLHTLLQANCFQKGRLRYQIEGRAAVAEEIDLLDDLGCIQEVTPRAMDRQFDGVLLLGALMPRVVSRLEYFLEQCRGRIHFSRLYLLGSDRKLDPAKELSLLPADTALATEIDMMLWAATGAQIPSHCQQIVPIRTPDVVENGKSRPANTGDTFRQWLAQTGFVSGRFLIVSNQPFVGFQELIAWNCLPDEMDLVTIGPAANTLLPLAVFMDNLAKTVYEFKNFLERHAAR
jgi:hypothetical protein